MNLVMVKGDRWKGSQFNPTTHNLLALIQRNRRMGFLVDQAWEDQFRKTSFVYLYKTYYAKFLLCNYCKEGASVVTYFWVPTQIRRKCKKIKNIFERKIKKIIALKRGCQNAQKMAKNWLRKFKNTKIEIWQYFVDWWEPYWQRKFNLRMKSPRSDVYGLN